MTDTEINSLLYDYDGSRRFRELCAALDQAREANRLRAALETIASRLPMYPGLSDLAKIANEALGGLAE